MSHKPSRIMRPEVYHFSDTDAFLYEPNGRSFSLTLYPPLFSPFPTVEVKHTLPPGLTAWTSFPVINAYRRIRERDGKVYYYLVIEYAGGILPTEGEARNEQTACYLVDQAGKILREGYYSFVGDSGEAVKNIEVQIDFEREAVEVEAANLKTKVNPPDLEEMTQTFDAWVKAPGLPEYRYIGDVRELRKAKKNPDKYQHFTKAWVWQMGEFKHLIALTEAGKYQVVSYGPDGGKVMDISTSTMLSALNNARGIVENYTPPPPAPAAPSIGKRLVESVIGNFLVDDSAVQV